MHSHQVFDVVWKTKWFHQNGIIKWKFHLLWSECLCPPRFICWNPNAHGDGTRRWAFGECLGHEGGVLGKGISALTKEAQSTPQSFPPYEDTTEAWFESGPSPNHPGILTWLPASRIVRSKCLFFIRTVVFCYSSLNRLRHHPILLPCRK